MFQLTLVTPNKKLLSEVEIEEVIVPAYRGELNILPGHAPLMTTLTAGRLKVKLKGESTFRSAAISWGYCEVNPQGVIVLSDTAEWPEEVDKDRAQKNLDTANKRLQDAGLSPADYAQIHKKISKERARLDLLN